jgi:hypothetical protein
MRAKVRRQIYAVLIPFEDGHVGHGTSLNAIRIKDETQLIASSLGHP